MGMLSYYIENVSLTSILVRTFGSFECRTPRWGGGGNSHMEQTGMLVGNFELTPKGDHLGVANAFCYP